MEPIQEKTTTMKNEIVTWNWKEIEDGSEKLCNQIVWISLCTTAFNYFLVGYSYLVRRVLNGFNTIWLLSYKTKDQEVR